MHASQRTTGLLLAALTVLAAAILFFVPPIPDLPGYYEFADRRTIFGIPNFALVVSNLPWLIIGLCGLARHRAGRFAVLFAALVLVAIGSAVFHWKPTPATMLWDRLPLAVLFMTFFSIVLEDRLPAVRFTLVPLIAAGIASVFYWHVTANAGTPDLRAYVFVQYFPLLAIPLLLAIRPARQTNTPAILSVLALYALAKLFEITDRPLYELTGLVSGHTLKHLTGAAASLFFFRLRS